MTLRPFWCIEPQRLAEIEQRIVVDAFRQSGLDIADMRRHQFRGPPRIVRGDRIGDRGVLVAGRFGVVRGLIQCRNKHSPRRQIAQYVGEDTMAARFRHADMEVAQKVAARTNIARPDGIALVRMCLRNFSASVGPSAAPVCKMPSSTARRA